MSVSLPLFHYFQPIGLKGFLYSCCIYFRFSVYCGNIFHSSIMVFIRHNVNKLSLWNLKYINHINIQILNHTYIKLWTDKALNLKELLNNLPFKGVRINLVLKLWWMYWKPFILRHNDVIINKLALKMWQTFRKLITFRRYQDHKHDIYISKVTNPW